MSIRRIHLLMLIAGFGALVLLGQLQVAADEHKLLLIGWTIIFYGALSLFETNAHLKSSIRIPTYMSNPTGCEAVDVFFDVDRIAMQHDKHHWDHDVVTDNTTENA